MNLKKSFCFLIKESLVAAVLFIKFQDCIWNLTLNLSGLSLNSFILEQFLTFFVFHDIDSFKVQTSSLVEFNFI